jgi:hypothetical protein
MLGSSHLLVTVGAALIVRSDAIAARLRKNLFIKSVVIDILFFNLTAEKASLPSKGKQIFKNSKKFSPLDTCFQLFLYNFGAK